MGDARLRVVNCLANVLKIPESTEEKGLGLQLRGNEKAGEGGVIPPAEGAGRREGNAPVLRFRRIRYWIIKVWKMHFQ